MNLQRLLVATAVLGACTGKDPATDATDPVSLDCDPAVPEEFCFFWQTDVPCELGGPRSFRLFEGALDADGGLTGTLRWYFFEDADPARTQIDVLGVTGQVSRDWTVQDLACVSCDVVLELTYTHQDVQTSWSYEGKQEVYALDWTNPNGGFQQDMGFLGARGRLNAGGNLQDVDPAQVRGTYVPDDGEPGSLPGALSWHPASNDGRCQERW